VLGGPALYLLGESLFRRRMTGTPNVKGLVVAAILAALAPVGGHVSAFALNAIVAALLLALALTEGPRRTKGWNTDDRKVTYG
jgi:low temperature requirement protein LtrA